MANNGSTYKLIQDLSKKFDEKFAEVDNKFAKIDTKLDFIKMDIKSVEKHADKIDERNEKRYNKVMNHIDGLAKGFKKFDEEQTVLSSQSKRHTTKIEKLEKRVFGTALV